MIRDSLIADYRDWLAACGQQAVAQVDDEAPEFLVADIAGVSMAAGLRIGMVFWHRHPREAAELLRRYNAALVDAGDAGDLAGVEREGAHVAAHLRDLVRRHPAVRP